LRNLSTWVQAHQEASRNPTRKIFLFAGSLFLLLSADFLPHGFEFERLALKRPFR
jgi:hypothetical protein